MAENLLENNGKLCGGMNGSTDGNSFNQMKEWLSSKFQRSTSCNIEGEFGRRYSRRSTTTPRIMISLVNDTSQMLSKRPKSLAISQKDSNESRARSQTSQPFYTEDSFLGRILPVSRTCTSLSKSLPSTPVYARPILTSDSGRKEFRFSQELQNIECHDPSSTPSHFDDMAVCAACGQQKQPNNLDLDTINNTLLSKERSHKPEKDAPNLFGSRHTKYVVMSSASDSQMFERSAKMIKAASCTEVQRPKYTKGREKVRRTGSKERDSKSTISLTRSWSFNIGKFKIRKSESTRSNDERLARQMSLTGNEILRGRKRRCSFYRIARSEKNLTMVTMEDGESCVESEASDDIVAYSPLLTSGAPRLINGRPTDEFKYTFETDSFRIPSIYGQIKIMFQFFNDNSQFLVSVLKGSNIARRKQGTLGVYMKVSLEPGKRQLKRGTDKHDTHDPVFYEHFSFHMSLDELLDRQLKIKLYNKPGIFSIPEPLGECTVPLFYYDLTAVTVIWQNLRKSKRQKDELEEFDFSIIERNQIRPRGLRSFLCGVDKKERKSSEQS